MAIFAGILDTCAPRRNADAHAMSPAADSPAEIAMPSLRFEKRAQRRGTSIVAGVDEVGRGPLAGRVVFAAVILNRRKIPEGINDSKALTPLAREALYNEILASGA